MPPSRPVEPASATGETPSRTAPAASPSAESAPRSTVAAESPDRAELSPSAETDAPTLGADEPIQGSASTQSLDPAALQRSSSEPFVVPVQRRAEVDPARRPGSGGRDVEPVADPPAPEFILAREPTASPVPSEPAIQRLSAEQSDLIPADQIPVEQALVEPSEQHEPADIEPQASGPDLVSASPSDTPLGEPPAGAPPVTELLSNRPPLIEGAAPEPAATVEGPIGSGALPPLAVATQSGVSDRPAVQRRIDTSAEPVDAAPVATALEPVPTMRPEPVEGHTEPVVNQPSITQPSITQPSAVQPSTVQPSPVQPSTVQPSPVQPSTVQPSAVQRTINQAGLGAPRDVAHPVPSRPDDPIDYPPLVARPVQRSAVDDHPGPTEQTAPLSGFAAAISALHEGEPGLAGHEALTGTPTPIGHEPSPGRPQAGGDPDPLVGPGPGAEGSAPTPASAPAPAQHDLVVARQTEPVIARESEPVGRGSGSGTPASAASGVVQENLLGGTSHQIGLSQGSMSSEHVVQRSVSPGSMPSGSMPSGSMPSGPMPSGPMRAGTVSAPAPSAGALSTTRSFTPPPAVPELVVARRVAPDSAGRLPSADVRASSPLQPSAGPAAQHSSGQGAAHPSPGLPLVQRTLLAGLPSLVSTRQAAIASAPVDGPPPVQRVRYEDHSAPSESAQTGSSILPVEGDSAAGLGVAMPTAPSDAAWSPVTLESSLAAGPSRGIAANPSSGVSASSGVAAGPSMSVQRAAATSWSAPHLEHTALDYAARDHSGPDHSRPNHTWGLDQPSGLDPLQPASGGVTDRTPLIQRRLDSSSSGFSADHSHEAPQTPGVDDLSAVSSRTVGLAEMFAMAAAQPSNAPSVQRSSETEVQLAPAETPSAAPTGSAPAPTAAPAGPPSGAELEEMARRLYDPLSARLRAELWQDRERAGLLTDLRP